jgi:hypothetical protein
MKAKTKYDIGDKVWLIDDNRAVMLDVTRVIISVENLDNCDVKYSLHYGDAEIPEEYLFKSKEELLKSL